MKDGLEVIMVVPDSNTTMERELRAYWPEVTRIHRVGVPRAPRPITVEELPEYRENTLKLVAPLAALHAHVVLYGCTTAGFLAGPERDAEVRDALADAAGAPAVTAATSMVEVLRHSGVRRPAVVTPYLDASNEGLAAFLDTAGLPVAALDSFRLQNIDDYDRVTPRQIHDMAASIARASAADGVFIACTQLRTLGVLDGLQQELGLPTWGAVQATVWAGKRALGLAGGKV